MKCKGRKQFVPTQFTQMSIRAAGAALGDHFILYQADAELANAKILGPDIIMRGTLAARPAASIAGRLYFATDNGLLYRDNGASWDQYCSLGFGGNPGDMIFAANPTTGGYSLLGIGANKTVLRSNGAAPGWSNKIVLTDPDGEQTLFQAANDLALLRLVPAGTAPTNGLLACTNSANNAFTFYIREDGRVFFNVGIVNDGGGVKHARAAYGAIAANSDVLLTVNWTTAFADANYTVVATAQDGSTIHVVCTITSKTAAQVQIEVKCPQTGSTGGTVHLIAFHD